jgi:TM2 domain-containing membrane protein YozV
MVDEFPSRDDLTGEVRLRRLPSPGVAAVLAVLIPGLGHVYVGRLLAGAGWFLAISFAYWAIILPGFLLHAISIWTAYQLAEQAGRGRFAR